MARKYSFEKYTRICRNGYGEQETIANFEILINGRSVADCHSKAMAEKIILGLKLVDEEERKRKEFRL